MSWISRTTQSIKSLKSSGIAKTLPKLTPGRRHFTTVTKPQFAKQSGNNYLNVALLGVLGSVSFYSYFNNNHSIQSDASVDTVDCNKAVDPIPIKISSPLSTQYELIGYGNREVSFLKFQVYALGLYIATEDLPLVKKILNSKFIESFYEDIDKTETLDEHRANLSRALNDPQVSNILIRNLLSSGVRFTARICAIRNTDLSHLRDGFIRTIRNNPNYSKLMKSEDVTIGERITKGLDDFRDVLNSVKISAKKNSLVYLEMDANQSIKVIVETTKKSGGSERNNPLVLGTVNEPLVAELLFESYAGAEKPLIKSVQTLSAENIVKAIC